MLRPLTIADAQVMHNVMVAGHKWGGFAVVPLEDVLAEFEDVGDLERDTTAVLTPSNELIAFGWLYPINLNQSDYRVDYWWAIVPKYEEPVAELLLIWLEKRARVMVADLPKDGKLRWCTGWCYDDMQERIALYEMRGYHLRHSEVFMRRDLKRPLPNPKLIANITFLPWTEERDELMYQAFLAGFRDRSKHVVSPEEWRRYYSGVSTFCPELSLIALLDSNGQDGEPVGMMRVLINESENGRSPHPEGEVGHIAVDPDYRRQGIASSMLYQAMMGLQVRGLDYLMLTVDVKNERAIRAYESVGMVGSKRYVSYRKDL